MLFIQESKIAANINSIIVDIWGWQNCGWEWVPSEGTSGGLITIWNEEVLREGGRGHFNMIRFS